MLDCKWSPTCQSLTLEFGNQSLNAREKKIPHAHPVALLRFSVCADVTTKKVPRYYTRANPSDVLRNQRVDCRSAERSGVGAWRCKVSLHLLEGTHGCQSAKRRDSFNNWKSLDTFSVLWHRDFLKCQCVCCQMKAHLPAALVHSSFPGVRAPATSCASLNVKNIFKKCHIFGRNAQTQFEWVENMHLPEMPPVVPTYAVLASEIRDKKLSKKNHL